MGKKKSSYAREKSGNSVVFKCISLGRLEFYKKPKNKIRLEQKIKNTVVKGDDNLLFEKSKC